MTFVPIQHRARAKQIYSYEGLNVGKSWATDVDALIEWHDRLYIVIELKRPNAPFPQGQKIALERMVNDFMTAGKVALLILAENRYKDPRTDCIVAECPVLRVYDGSWHEPKYATVADYVNAYIKEDVEEPKGEDCMNNVVLIGRIVNDLKCEYVGASGTARLRFAVAIDRPTRGEEKKTDFPSVVVWGKQAENCEKFLAKGRQVAISGRIETGKYQNKNGDTVYTTDVVANVVEFLDAKGSTPKPKEEPQEVQLDMADNAAETFEQIDEDVPF